MKDVHGHLHHPSGQGETSGKYERSRAWTRFGIVIGADITLMVLGFMFFRLIGGYIDVQKLCCRPLELVGVPGDTIRLRLFHGTSYGGAWGSSAGVHLRFGNRESRFKVTILLPRWVAKSGDGEESDLLVRGSLVVPPVSGEESLVGTLALAGTLTGDIRYLRSKSDITGGTHNIQVPVRLRVVRRGHGLTSGKRRGRDWGAFWIGSAGYVAVLAFAIVNYL